MFIPMQTADIKVFDGQKASKNQKKPNSNANGQAPRKKSSQSYSVGSTARRKHRSAKELTDLSNLKNISESELTQVARNIQRNRSRCISTPNASEFTAEEQAIIHEVMRRNNRQSRRSSMSRINTPTLPSVDEAVEIPDDSNITELGSSEVIVEEPRLPSGIPISKQTSAKSENDRTESFLQNLCSCLR